MIKIVASTRRQIEGEEFYVIENVDQMNPFFMTLVSSSDHWMFISSNGGLSAAGRMQKTHYFHIIPMIKSLSHFNIQGSRLF